MPYLLLIIGLLIGAFALMKFFQSATPAQVIALLQALFSILLLGACFFLAVTGRVGAAVAIAGALIPMFAHYFFSKRRKAEGVGAEQGEHTDAAPHAKADISSRKEALEVLGLAGEPTKAEIEKAYKALMKKLHPDQGGNAYLAQKLTAARDYLLK